jgi:hypothetical protein
MLGLCNLPGGGGIGPVVDASGAGAPVVAVEARWGTGGSGAASVMTISYAINQVQEK